MTVASERLTHVVWTAAACVAVALGGRDAARADAGTTVAHGPGMTLAQDQSLAPGDLILEGRLSLADPHRGPGARKLSVARFVSRGGSLVVRVNDGTLDRITADTPAPSSMSGYTGVEIDATADSRIAPGTYTIVSAPAGGLIGKVGFVGGQRLTVPAQTAIQTIGCKSYRLTLAATGTAITLTVEDAPARVVRVLPMGSSITAGEAHDVPSYDGGGYRSQLYQNLINDGRFTPVFLGNETKSYASKPDGPDLMTVVGQPRHEGHPGWPTGAILDNLEKHYLTPGNGTDPDYVTLNIGGNDYVFKPTDTTALGRLDQILSTIARLRPDATTVVSSIVIRTDRHGEPAKGFNTLYSPFIPGLVRKHVLAGHHIVFLDLGNLMSIADLGPDHIHPLQSGYDRMADAWYGAIAYGQAFYTGAAGTAWDATNGGKTAFAQDFRRTTDAGRPPSARTDVYFNGVGGATTPGSDLTVRSVNFTADATTPVRIDGTSTLTVGSTFVSAVTGKPVPCCGGITLQGGTAAHTVAAPVRLGVAQAWTNASGSPFTVSGRVSGVGELTFDGGGVVVLSGDNDYSGPTTVSAGTLVAGNRGGSATGRGTLSVSGEGTLAGTGRVAGATTIAGTLAPGDPATGTGRLTLGPTVWKPGGRLRVRVGDAAAAGSVAMAALRVEASPDRPFVVEAAADHDVTLPADAAVLLAAVTEFADADLQDAARAAELLSRLSLKTTGLQPAPGHAFRLAARPVRAGDPAQGLWLTQIAQER